MPKQLAKAKSKTVSTQRRTQTSKKDQPEAERVKTAVEKKQRSRSPKRTPTQVQKEAVIRSKSGMRMLQVPTRIWRRPSTWRNRPPVPEYKPLPKAWVLLRRVLKQLWANRRLFGGIALLYGVLNLTLVRGISGGSQLANFKASLDGLFSGNTGALGTSVLTFGYLLSKSGSSANAQSGAYQSILLIICSLAFIWALRQVVAEHKVWRIRDSFYRGMYPMVPFILLFLLLGLQLLPMVAGGALYSTVVGGGIAVHWWEKAVWLGILLGLSLWSLRMVTASIFALYIVTLPDMTPLRAYRSARKLVYGRRLMIWRKLIFLPFVLLVLAALIEIPLILTATSLAAWTFFLLSMAALPMVHGYIYNLYRDML